MEIINEIKKCIEAQLIKGRSQFIIFPFGDIGMQIKTILKEAYDIKVSFIIDNNLCRYNNKIKPSSFLNQLNPKEYTLILSSIDDKIYETLKAEAAKYFDQNNIAEINYTSSKKIDDSIVGKYSFGPICENTRLIDSIGAFCSIAPGSIVVPNHPMKYVSTHTFLYKGNRPGDKPYKEYKGNRYYFDDISPKGVVEKSKKSTIGNDVWLGKNVIITNGANIGNGVIAGAGSVITKDIPDYAVVVGVPARIIRYRYNKEQIEALNRIQWWNWPDDTIRERYNDFYLHIEDFIEKYDK